MHQNVLCSKHNYYTCIWRIVIPNDVRDKYMLHLLQLWKNKKGLTHKIMENNDIILHFSKSSRKYNVVVSPSVHMSPIWAVMLQSHVKPLRVSKHVPICLHEVREQNPLASVCVVIYYLKPNICLVHL